MSATRRGPCRSPGRRDVGQPARSRPRIGVTPIRTEVGSDRSQREAKEEKCEADRRVLPQHARHLRVCAGGRRGHVGTAPVEFLERAFDGAQRGYQRTRPGGEPVELRCRSPRRLISRPSRRRSAGGWPFALSLAPRRSSRMCRPQRSSISRVPVPKSTGTRWMRISSTRPARSSCWPMLALKTSTSLSPAAASASSGVLDEGVDAVLRDVVGR